MRHKNQFDVFERIESIRALLLPWVPDGNSVKIRALLIRCVQFRSKRIKTLTKGESEFYDCLLYHKLNPKTAYEYFLLEDVPPELRTRMQENKLSLNTAQFEFVKWKKMSNYSSAQTLLQEVKEVIGRLRWKSQETTERPD